MRFASWSLLLVALTPLALRAAAPPQPPGRWLPKGARAVFKVPGGSVSCLAASADGRSVVVAVEGTGWVWLMDVPSRRVRHKLLLPQSERAACLAFSPDGKTLAVGTAAGRVYLHDPATGKRMVRIEAHPKRTNALAFSPDGATLATGGDEPSVRMWEVKTGKPIREILSDNADHRTVCFSPDGKLLAAGGDGKDLTLWDPQTGNVVLDCLGKPGDIRFAAFIPSGKRVVWASERRFIRINDTATGDELADYGRSGVSWNAFDLSPAGSVLATAGKDGRVQLWDLASSHQLLAFSGHVGATRAVAYFPNGKRLVSGGADGRVIVWDVPTLTRTRMELWWVMLASDLLKEVQLAEDGLNRADALPFLAERLNNCLQAQREVSRLLLDLDANDFTTRERATEKLVWFGRLSRAPLERLLASKPNLEVYRRAQRILNRMPDSVDEERSGLLALGVVDKIGSPEARKLLQSVAGSRVQSPIVQEARAIVKRLPALDKR
jgi:WD40 repeat protein